MKNAKATGNGARALALLLACSCERSSDRKPPPAEQAQAQAAAPLPAPEPGVPETKAAASAPAPRREKWAFDPCGASPKSGKSIGHTSTVFKLELSNGKKVAWKPNSKKVHTRYKGEIAAYRLALALGIDNVLPACPQAFEVGAISAVLESNADAAKVLASEAVVEDGKIHGAAVMWFDGLAFWPLEKDPLHREARAWLTAGKEIPAAKLDLARQTSSLIAFDFITGNWDRYSGENVGIDGTGSLVLYIDNDAAFMEGAPPAALAKNQAAVIATDRFSRTLIAHLRELDDGMLTRVFGDESLGRPLLSPSVISLIGQRINMLVGLIDGKIQARGEPETLYFR